MNIRIYALACTTLLFHAFTHTMEGEKNLRKKFTAQQICALLATDSEYNNNFCKDPKFIISLLPDLKKSSKPRIEQEELYNEAIRNKLQEWVKEAITNEKVRGGTSEQKNQYLVYEAQSQKINFLNRQTFRPIVAILFGENGIIARIVSAIHEYQDITMATLFITNLYNASLSEKDNLANQDLLNIVEKILKDEGVNAIFVTCARDETDNFYEKQLEYGRFVNRWGKVLNKKQ